MDGLLPQAPPTTRLNRQRLFGVGLPLLLLAGGGIVYFMAQQDTAPLPSEQLATLRPPKETAEGPIQSVADVLGVRSYEQVKLYAPSQETTPAPPATQAPTSETNPFLEPSTPGPQTPPGAQPPRQEARPLQAPPVLPKPPRPRAATAPAQPALSPAVAPPKPRPWLFATLPVVKPPYEDQAPLQPGGPRGAGGTSPLFAKAQWATPDDPTRVLYRSQLLRGQLAHAINSDVPGDVHIMLTEAVTDVLGQGVELLPQGALLIGKQQGATQYGDSRLPLAIDEAQFPDGTVVAFTQAKVGDSRGAAALEGSVNNHYGKLAAGVFATAALSIGTRAAAGNTASFQQTYQQEFARDVSANINQQGQTILQRQLNVRPTITIPAGTPVTVFLSQNVSFQTPPQRVRE